MTQCFQNPALALIDDLVAATAPDAVMVAAGESADDAGLWAVTGVWESVGNYRRSQSKMSTRMAQMDLARYAVEPSVTAEVRRWARDGGDVTELTSDLADRDDDNGPRD